MIVKERVHSTETTVDALRSTDKDGSLKIQTNKSPVLKLVWARQLLTIEGFCVQDYYFGAKSYVYFKAIKGENPSDTLRTSCM